MFASAEFDAHYDEAVHEEIHVEAHGEPVEIVYETQDHRFDATRTADLFPV